MERPASRENLAWAYTLVFRDLTENGPNLFMGFYDAKHGNEDFMYGICTVIEYMEQFIDIIKPDDQRYGAQFIKNMCGCKQLAMEDEKRGGLTETTVPLDGPPTKS